MRPEKEKLEYYVGLRVGRSLDNLISSKVKSLGVTKTEWLKALILQNIIK